MPRTRPLETYPYRQFMAVFSRVAADRQPFLIPCTAAQAASLRGELYAFRRACEHSPAAAASMGISVQVLRDVAFRIDPGRGLEAIHQSALVNPALIEAALGAPAPEVRSAAQAALDRLRGLGVAPDPAVGPHDL